MILAVAGLVVVVIRVLFMFLMSSFPWSLSGQKGVGSLYVGHDS